MVESLVIEYNSKFIIVQILFGIGCPAAVNATGEAISTNKSGAATMGVASDVIAGNNQCNVRKKKCKRSVSIGII